MRGALASMFGYLNPSTGLGDPYHDVLVEWEGDENRCGMALKKVNESRCVNRSKNPGVK